MYSGNGERKFCFDFIEVMIESGVLLFGDFTLKSGRKSPYFINTGEFKTGRQLSELGGFYLRLVEHSVGNAIKDEIKNKFNVLFGPAYKGIALANLLGAKLAENGIDMYVSYDRKERKDHGDKKDILGYCPVDGDRIAIIEDVTTAGTSVREVMALLEKSDINAEITALYIAIDRMEKGTGDVSATEQIKRDYGIDVYSIATVRDIIDYLENCESMPDAVSYADKINKYLERYGSINYLE